MSKFFYNILVSVAYVLGLFLFVIKTIFVEGWVLYFLALGLIFFFLYSYIKK